MVYQNKIWGGSQVKLRLNCLAYLRLKYTLTALKGIPSKSKVFEVGCGGGGFIKGVKLLRPDLNYYAIDINKKAIEFAKKGATGIRFGVGDAINLPFDNNYFDCVIVEDLLEHLKDPYKALLEIKRVLKKGGVVTAYVPLEGDWYTLHAILGKLGWKYKEKLAGHIQEFTFREILKEFKKNGFDVQKLFFGPHLLGQLVDVLYFTYTGIFANFKPSLEERIKDPVLIFIKNLLTVTVNLESLIFPFVPAAGIYLECQKK